MTILKSFCSTTILSSSTEFVLFACAQSSTSWYQNAGHADICASTVMTVDNDNDADDVNFDDTLSEILGASSMQQPHIK